MSRIYPSLTALLLGTLSVACGPGPADSMASSAARSSAPSSPEVTPVVWTEVDALDVEAFNADIEPGKLTLDVGVYFPSNLDPEYDMVTLPRLMESLEAAKEIYADGCTDPAALGEDGGVGREPPRDSVE